MASYTYWKVNRKVSIGGSVSLVDSAIVGACNYLEALDVFEKEQHRVKVEYDTEIAKGEELSEFFKTI